MWRKNCCQHTTMKYILYIINGVVNIEHGTHMSELFFLLLSYMPMACVRSIFIFIVASMTIFAMRIFPAFIFGELNELQTGKRDKSQQYIAAYVDPLCNSIHYIQWLVALYLIFFFYSWRNY